MKRHAIARVSLGFLVASLGAFWTPARAAEIKVLSSNAVASALPELLPQFERATGHKVSIVYDTTNLLLEKVKGGAVADAVILTRPAIDDLVKQGKVAAGSGRDLARSGVGIAVRAGLPKPDIRTPEALKRALLDARSIAFSSSGASGVYFEKVLERLGIAEQVKAKAKRPPGGAVAEIVAKGEADMAAQQVSELATAPGLELVGPLPAELQSFTVFTAGVMGGAAQPQAASVLIDLLAAPAATAVLVAKGMEPVPGAAQGVALRLLSTTGMHSVMKELLPAFERATGYKVAGDFDTTNLLMERIKRGDSADLVFLTRPAIDDLVKQGKVAAGTDRDLARSGVGVAIRAGVPKPDISTPEALKRALLDAKSIAYTGTGASGLHFARVVERLGIAEQVKAKARIPAGGSVGELVARGEAEMAVQQVPELLGVKSIQYVGPLPADLQSFTVFTAGMPAGASQVEAARALVRFLTTPAAVAVIKAYGMEPAGAPPVG